MNFGNFGGFGDLGKIGGIGNNVLGGLLNQGKKFIIELNSANNLYKENGVRIFWTFFLSQPLFI